MIACNVIRRPAWSLSILLLLIAMTSKAPTRETGATKGSPAAASITKVAAKPEPKADGEPKKAEEKAKPVPDTKQRKQGKFRPYPSYLERYSHANPTLRLSRAYREVKATPFDTLEALRTLRKSSEMQAAARLAALENETTYNPRKARQPPPLYTFPQLDRFGF